MDVEAHEILFSFDQPATVLPSLLTVVQQVLTQQKTRGGKSVPLYEGHRVLIIDGQQERATYLLQVLSLAGYRSIAVAHSLEAFTLFLQGSFIPLLLLLGQDDPAKRFFFLRLQQQMLQRFDVEVPIVRLVTQGSAPIENVPRAIAPPLKKTLFTPVPPSALWPQHFESFEAYQQSQHYPGPVSGDLIADVSAAPNGIVPLVQTLAPAPQTAPLQPMSTPVLLKKHIKISLVGQSLGRYQIEALLSEGASSNVYKVYDRLRENRVVLKAVQTDSVSPFGNALAMEEEHIFQQEANLMVRLKHPHIAPVLNTGKTYISGSSFMYKTMPLYTEGSLMQWLYEYGGNKMRAPQEILPLILQLADALQYAHDQQILFLNFKPNNILVKAAVKSIDTAELALADFAIARDSTPLAYTVDTFPYMAPERWEGYTVPASDQYALAVLTYELLSGRPLFQGTTEQIMRRLHLTIQPLPPSQFNRGLSIQASGVIMRALAKRPEERFASVGLFAQALQRFCL